MSIAEPLLKASNEVIPFNSNSFLSVWWEMLAEKFSPQARQGQLGIFKKKVVKQLFPLKVMRIAGWNNHYYQVLTDAHFRDFQILKERHAWDYFEVYINEHYTCPSWFECFEAQGFPVLRLDDMSTPVIDISNGWDGYWAQKSRKYKRGIQNKLKATQDLEPRLVYYSGLDGIDYFFGKFIPLHREYWDERSPEGSYLHDPREQAFIKTWAHKLEKQGQLQLSGLLLGGELTNLRMNILCDRTLYWLLTLNTGLYEELHPGFICTHLAIQDACNLGFRKIDLGPGSSDYKKKIGTSEEKGYRMIVINPRSPAGQLYHYWKRKEIEASEKWTT